MNKLSIFLSLMTMCSCLSVFAQSAPPATPIDGGLGLLLAGGAAYGVKKIRDQRRK